MNWRILEPGLSLLDLGAIVSLLRDDDPRPARDQLGGWRPIPELTLLANDGLALPSGDELTVTYPIAKAQLGRERVACYRGGYVAIVQPDGAYEVARLGEDDRDVPV